MGIVWEAYHKGVPLLGLLKIPLIISNLIQIQGIHVFRNLKVLYIIYITPRRWFKTIVYTVYTCKIRSHQKKCIRKKPTGRFFASPDQAAASCSRVGQLPILNFKVFSESCEPTLQGTNISYQWERKFIFTTACKKHFRSTYWECPWYFVNGCPNPCISR